MNISPISSIILEGREFLVKRDDLIGEHLAGNKYRKLHTLINSPKKSFKKIISYGGTQSNAMLALASLCQEKEWEFIYYTKPISDAQKKNNVGNYTLSLGLGMQHIEIDYNLYRDFIASLSINKDEHTYLVAQGGADVNAKEGIEKLAQEIYDASLDVKTLAIPSGTGTTALYLALAMPDYKVYTIACIGDSEYLKQQMQALHCIPPNLIILQTQKKYHFAKVYKDFLDMHKQLQKSDIEFDLLYAPALWITLLEQTKEKILYIHSGGVSGNESMLLRYKRANL